MLEEKSRRSIVGANETSMLKMNLAITILVPNMLRMSHRREKVLILLWTFPVTRLLFTSMDRLRTKFI